MRIQQPPYLSPAPPFTFTPVLDSFDGLPTGWHAIPLDQLEVKKDNCYQLNLSKSLRVDGISVKLRMENGHLFIYVSPVIAAPESEEDQKAISEYCETH